MNHLQRSKGRERRKDRKMTTDEMLDWFKSAPEGSPHERMLWAARKIARLTGGHRRWRLSDAEEFKDCG
jgi:hypothetical protein